MMSRLNIKSQNGMYFFEGVDGYMFSSFNLALKWITYEKKKVEIWKNRKKNVQLPQKLS